MCQDEKHSILGLAELGMLIRKRRVSEIKAIRMFKHITSSAHPEMRQFLQVQVEDPALCAGEGENSNHPAKDTKRDRHPYM